MSQPRPTDLFVDAIAKEVTALILPQIREGIREELSKREHPPPEKKRLSPREVARQYRRSPNTVYKALGEGELKYVADNGRYWIRPEDAERWANG